MNIDVNSLFLLGILLGIIIGIIGSYLENKK